MVYFKYFIFIFNVCVLCWGYKQLYPNCDEKMSDVFKWKQMEFDFDGIVYKNNADFEWRSDNIYFKQEVNDSEKFFIQYNNVPIGFEAYGDRVFISVPRRRYGIPSTLNYVQLSGQQSPALKPYPDSSSRNSLISVYRPRVDSCGRLWMVDTGMLEVPGERKQIQPPAIVVYDLNTNKQVLRYELKPSDLVDERTPAGLTSITVDVDAHAYINDLATNGMIVFSLRKRDSWRIEHDSFEFDDNAANFTVAGHVINWRDGLFSIALSAPDASGHRKAFFHPLVSTQEFVVDTQVLKNGGRLEDHVQLLGTRGPLTQSGSHDYHSRSKTLFFGNVAQNAILCWNTRRTLSPETVAVAVQDHQKLVYISGT